MYSETVALLSSIPYLAGFVLSINTPWKLVIENHLQTTPVKTITKWTYYHYTWI